MRSLLVLFAFTAPILAADPLPDYAEEVQPLLRKYCANCHNDKKAQGELNLARFTDEAAVLKARKVWADVLGRTSGREMPPDDAAQPTAKELELLTKWAAGTVKRIDAATPPQAGRVTMRRLNRIEYRNTVRDLFGLQFDLAWDPTRDFPADGAGYGFDNIGDVLGVSPLHMEKYLAAANLVLERAIVIDGLDGPRTWKFTAKELRSVSPTKPKDGVGMWPTNWVAEIDVRQAGEYRVKAVIRTEANNGKAAQMAVQSEGRQPDKFTFTRQGKVNAVERKIVIPEAGRRQLWVAYLYEQNKKLFEEADAGNGEIVVESLEVTGPYFPAEAVPESHKRLFVSRPSKEKSRTQAAEEILAAFLPKAFRRPFRDGELARYLGVFEKADRPGESFEAAMMLPLKAALVSPHFLYRIEVDRPAKDGSYPLGPYELASRLSYFLWSSLPDDELFKLAANGTLVDPKVMESQAQRMIADPRATALSENFVSQWLQIRSLDTHQPDSKLGKIGTGLRNGMQQEPILVFHEILTKNLPLRTLIDADFTYANEELAKFYKLPPAPEHAGGAKPRNRDRMIRYPLPAEAHRGGITTMGAVLVATSHPDRTSPVKRGKWVLDALLGAPPPPPPPSVEALKDEPQLKGKLTLRQRLEAHRSNATCASCHKRMDPLGFAFENYDALGRWRDKDGNLAVDASAELPDGRRIAGVAGLNGYLLQEQDAFIRNVVTKLLTYALGRGVEPFDARAVDAIAEAVKKDGDRLSRVVLSIVTSHPFRFRSTTETEVKDPAK